MCVCVCVCVCVVCVFYVLIKTENNNTTQHNTTQTPIPILLQDKLAEGAIHVHGYNMRPQQSSDRTSCAVRDGMMFVLDHPDRRKYYFGAETKSVGLAWIKAVNKNIRAGFCVLCVCLFGSAYVCVCVYGCVYVCVRMDVYMCCVCVLMGS